VASTLRSRGRPVRALVRNATQAAALEALGAEPVLGDVCRPESLDSALHGIDIVYHCAAAVGPNKGAGEIYATNRDGVRKLLDAVHRAGSPRVVLLSSVNVLGSLNLDAATEDLPCIKSHDPAADAKVDAERIAQEFKDRHGLGITIVRPG